MNDQLFSWTIFPMIKVSNQGGLNIKVVFLSSSFKEIPSLWHLEHHGSSYDHLEMGVSNSSNAQHLEKNLTVSS